MKKYIAIISLLLGLLFSTAVSAHAQNGQPRLISAPNGSAYTMDQMMDQMMRGELTPRQQTQFYTMMNDGDRDGMMWRDGWVVGPFAWLAIVIWLAFVALTLSLLVLGNVALYHKVMNMKSKKKK